MKPMLRAYLQCPFQFGCLCIDMNVYLYFSVIDILVCAPFINILHRYYLSQYCPSSMKTGFANLC